MNPKIMAALISIVTLLAFSAESSAIQSQTAPSFRFQDSPMWQSGGPDSRSYQPPTSQQYSQPYRIPNSVGPSQTYVPQQSAQTYRMHAQGGATHQYRDNAHLQSQSGTQYGLPPIPFARSGSFPKSSSNVPRLYGRSSYAKWRDNQSLLSRSYEQSSIRREVPKRDPSSMAAKQDQEPRKIIQLRSPSQFKKQVVQVKQPLAPKQEPIQPLPIEKPPAPKQIVKPQMPVVQEDPGALEFRAREPVVRKPVVPTPTEPSPFAPEPKDPSPFAPETAELSPFAPKQPQPPAFEPKQTPPPEPSSFAAPETSPKNDFVPTPPASNQFKVAQENVPSSFAPPKPLANGSETAWSTKKVEPKFQPKPVQEDPIFEVKTPAPTQPKPTHEFSIRKPVESQFAPPAPLSNSDWQKSELSLTPTPKSTFEKTPSTPKSEKIKIETVTTAQKTNSRKADLILEKGARKTGWFTTLAWILIPLLGLLGLGFLLKKFMGSNSDRYREYQNEAVQYSRPTRYQEYENSADQRSVRTSSEVARAKTKTEQPVRLMQVESAPATQTSNAIPSTTRIKSKSASFEKARSRFESDEIDNLVTESSVTNNRIKKSDELTVYSSSSSGTSCNTNLEESCCNSTTGCESDRDDLTFIHGIDEEAQKAFYGAGYYRFSQLANADEADLKKALVNSNVKYKNANVRTWKALAEKTAMLPQYRRAGESPTVSSRVVTQRDKTKVTKKTVVENKVVKKPVAKKQVVEVQSDNLTRLRGIDSEASKLLRESGIESYKQLYDAGPARLASIFSSAGPKFASVDTSQWTSQAKFAVENDWDGLNNWWQENPEQTATSTKVVKKPVAKMQIVEVQSDNLTRLRGIDSEASKLLRESGIESYKQLYDAGPARLASIFSGAGPKFASVDTSQWTSQAKFAVENDWDGLNNWWQENPGQTAASTKQEMTPQKPVETKPTQTAASTNGNSSDLDDLTLIKGIGSATKRHLKKHGITSFAHIAESTTDRFEEIFSNTGNRFQKLNFETWAEQAKALMASGGTVNPGFVARLADISSTMPGTTTGG